MCHLNIISNNCISLRSSETRVFLNKEDSEANGPLVHRSLFETKNTSPNHFSDPLKPFLHLESAVQFFFLLHIWTWDWVTSPQVSFTFILKVKSCRQKWHFGWIKKTSNKVITLVISAKYSPHCALFVKLTQSGIIWHQTYRIAPALFHSPHMHVPVHIKLLLITSIFFCLDSIYVSAAANFYFHLNLLIKWKMNIKKNRKPGG